MKVMYNSGQAMLQGCSSSKESAGDRICLNPSALLMQSIVSCIEVLRWAIREESGQYYRYNCDSDQCYFSCGFSVTVSVTVIIIQFQLQFQLFFCELTILYFSVSITVTVIFYFSVTIIVTVNCYTIFQLFLPFQLQLQLTERTLIQTT